MSTETHEPHGVAHIMPMKVLVGVFLALMVLTVMTVAASNQDFGSYNLLVAIAIAVVKASLVVLYFMHLRYDNPFNAIVFVGCLIFVSLFMFLSLTDTTAYHSSVIRKQADRVKQFDLQRIEKNEARRAPE
jgi:cytochrome c oxidase subunit IV